MSQVDVLIITALQEEFEAARIAGSAKDPSVPGVSKWTSKDSKTTTPYLLGEYVVAAGRGLSVALARPTRMGGVATAPIVAALVERLRPRCLAMCGVCAGNPSDVALGDVIIGEMVYPYSEGKQKKGEFEGDHRQTPLKDNWVRAAQELDPRGFACYGEVTEKEARRWILDRLYVGDNPKSHPAHLRYFPGNDWERIVKRLESSGVVTRKGTTLKLTRLGRDEAESQLFYKPPPKKLPFQIKVGPIASGNVVVKDGLTWEKLKKWGVRSVLGLEMEAATIGSSAHRLGVEAWVVVKGVMDHADPRKDDRYKAFAAKASAEVLYKLLVQQLMQHNPPQASEKLSLAKAVYVIGGPTGETNYPSFEEVEFGPLCQSLGDTIARSGAELIVCSPFPGSLDSYTVMGYVNSGVGAKVHFHSPKHISVEQHRKELQSLLGKNDTGFRDWTYPAPENDDAWEQSWLLCQLQALEYADVVIAIGGHTSKSANTLLHLAESRRIPVVPYAFYGGAAEKAFARRDWQATHGNFDVAVLKEKGGVTSAMRIADKLITDRMNGSGRNLGAPRRVFISRSSADTEFADSLIEYLSEEQITPLLGDNAVRADSAVPASIDEYILKCDTFIVLWSANYALSRWCADELEFALERERIGDLRIWFFNLDGTDIVPRQARRFPLSVTRTPQTLVEVVRRLVQLHRK